jgi:DNA-directed RNA polymerase subunit RPC12/RpoP
VKEAREIECSNCSAKIELLSLWRNTCSECGAEYNGDGQRLAPVEQWGAETGEDWVVLANLNLNDIDALFLSK